MAKRVSKWVAFTLLLLLSLYLILWASSPWLARYVGNQFLEPYQLQLSEDSSIRLNPFNWSVSITQLQLEHKRQPSLQISDGRIDIDAWALIAKRQVLFEQFHIDGLVTQVAVDNNELRVAGVNPSDFSQAEQSSRIPSTEEASAPLTISNPLLQLTNSRLDLDYLGNKHQLVLNQLTLRDLMLAGTRLDGQLNLALELDGSSLEVGATLNQSGAQLELKSSVTINQLQLERYQSYLPDPIVQLSGSLDLDTQLHFSMDGQQQSLQIQDLLLATKEVNFAQPELQVTVGDQKLALSQFSWNLQDNLSDLMIEDLRVAIARANATHPTAKVNLAEQELILNKVAWRQQAGEPDVLTLGGQLTLNQLAVTDAEQAKLVSIASLELEKFSLQQQQSWQLMLQQLSIGQLLASQPSQENAPLIQMAKLAIDHAELSADSLALEALTITGLNAQPILNQSKQLANLVQLAQAPSSDAVDQTQAPDAAAKPFHASFQQLIIDGDSQVVFIDNSVKPRFVQKLTLEQFELSQIDNQKPDQQTLFAMQGAIDDYGKLIANGQVTLFNPVPSGDINVEIDQVSLPPASPYLNQVLGFGFLSGHLDNKLSLTINQGKLKGESKLKLRGIELEKSAEQADIGLKEQTAIPLNVALGMLKDSKGNVKLDIPLAGSTQDPQFGLTGFIKVVVQKAVWSATKSYLMDTFVPYANVVSVLFSAGEFVMKLRFNDLAFEPKQTVISEAQQEYMQQFIGLMQKEKGAEVKVCGFATLQDLTEKERDTLPQQEALNVLRELAEQRGQAFKKWVLGNSTIESRRMLLCQPKAEIKPTQPRIEISS